MGLIKKASELDIQSNLRMMVYGSAGAGKTTLALSAPKPLLLDFDNGVKRVNTEHLKGVDIVQITSWDDVIALFNEDLSPYETIVVDTIGKMMDFIITYKCGTRMPQVQDWTGINQQFQWFTRAISGLNKHIVYIAHRDTRKEGDKIIYIPALREKSYNAIVTELDLLGYLEMRNVGGQQVRTITYDPTDRNDGKNTCNLPAAVQVPGIINGGQVTAANEFITRAIIKPYGEMIEQKKALIHEFEDVMAEIKVDIDNIDDADSANAFVANVRNYKHVGSSLMQARALLSAKAAELGLKYNSSTRMYE